MKRYYFYNVKNERIGACNANDMDDAKLVFARRTGFSSYREMQDSEKLDNERKPSRIVRFV